MRFVKLHSVRTKLSNGDVVKYGYVNADKIVSIWPSESREYRSVIITNEPEGLPIYVEENPEEVLLKIAEAGYVSMFTPTAGKETK